MFPSINPTTTQAWQKLAAHAAQMKEMHLKELFAQDAHRFQKFSQRFNEILIDL